MRKKSNLQDEMKFLNVAISTLKGPLKHVTWIHEIRMNMQVKLMIRIVQISFTPELCICEYEGLKQREKRQCHDFFHEIMTHYENNQVNT